MQPNPWCSARGNGGGCFEPKQREQERQLVAKVGAQDSSMRLLRADVTTLRKRLRRQGEVLAKQIEENEVVRHSAEQVCIANRRRGLGFCQARRPNFGVFTVCQHGAVAGLVCVVVVTEAQNTHRRLLQGRRDRRQFAPLHTREVATGLH